MISSIGAPLQTLGAPNTPLWIVHSETHGIRFYSLLNSSIEVPRRWKFDEICTNARTRGFLEHNKHTQARIQEFSSRGGGGRPFRKFWQAKKIRGWKTEGCGSSFPPAEIMFKSTFQTRQLFTYKFIFGRAWSFVQYPGKRLSLIVSIQTHRWQFFILFRCRGGGQGGGVPPPGKILA